MATESVSNVSFLLGDYNSGFLTVEGTEDDILAKGTMLVYNKLTGKYKVYTGGTQKPTAIVLVAAVVPAEGYIDVVCAVQGEFNGNGLVFPSGITLDAVPASKSTAIAIAAVEGNTGNGTAGSITQGNLAKEGTYNLVCSDDSGSGNETFQVFDPDGNRLADLTVGVAYDNGHFGVTISDGSYDFVVGDAFTVVPKINADGTLRMMLKEKGLIVKDVVEMND